MQNNSSWLRKQRQNERLWIADINSYLNEKLFLFHIKESVFFQYFFPSVRSFAIKFIIKFTWGKGPTCITIRC